MEGTRITPAICFTVKWKSKIDIPKAQLNDFIEWLNGFTHENGTGRYSEYFCYHEDSKYDIPVEFIIEIFK